MDIRRRALVCAPRPPEYDRESGARRVFDLISFLQEAGWNVTFVAREARSGDPYLEMLKRRGVSTHAGPGTHVDAIIEDGGFDLAVVAFWHLAEEYLPRIRRRSPKTPVVVDSVDLHFVREGRRTGRRAASKARELNAYLAADGVWTVSQEEADLLNELIGDPELATCVPDTEEGPTSSLGFAERRGILFVGNFWHRPNLEAAGYLCQEVVPRLGHDRLLEHPVYIVGNALNGSVEGCAGAMPGVHLVGWVPSVVPYYHRARVSVVPVLHGAGTKRKLLQALALGTPSVSTTIGAEGLGLQHGEHVLIADDPQRFAQATVQLLEDQALWKKLARQGRDHVANLHGREVVRTRLAEAVHAVLLKEPKSSSLSVRLVSAAARIRRRQRQLAESVREAARSLVPPGAIVLVASRGDDELLKLDGRTGWHYPQGNRGEYAGYYPADSSAAIDQLEKLRNRGAAFLMFPEPAVWWLDHYAGLRKHLVRHYRVAAPSSGGCVVFDLG